MGFTAILHFTSLPFQNVQCDSVYRINLILNGVCLIRIRALRGQIMEKDAMISVLHYRLQQEQEKDEEGEGVSSACPAHPDSSSSYHKGKNVVVVTLSFLTRSKNHVKFCF